MSSAPTISSADNFKRAIRSCMSKTYKKNKKEIDMIIETVENTELFCMELAMIEPHINIISNGRFPTSKQLNRNRNHKRCMDLANREFFLMDIFFDLFREIGEAIRSLVIGNYFSIPRSLRWIIESSVFWADLQSDSKTAIDAYEYYKQEIPLKDSQYYYLKQHIYETNANIIDERLFLKDKWQKYGLADIIENDIIKTNNINYNKPRGYVFKKEIQQLYKKFSGFEHISLDSLNELYEDRRTDYSMYMNYKYNVDTFQSNLNNLWNVLDIICCIAILGCCFFYGYSKTSDYINAIQNFYVNDSSTKDLLTYVKNNNLLNRLSNFSMMI